MLSGFSTSRTGVDGLKTGSTSKAGFCISATAERDGMSLICVIMGAPSRDVRNAAAASLLDYGFANYEYASITPRLEANEVLVKNGVAPKIKIAAKENFGALLKKSEASTVAQQINLKQK